MIIRIYNSCKCDDSKNDCMCKECTDNDNKNCDCDIKHLCRTIKLGNTHYSFRHKDDINDRTSPINIYLGDDKVITIPYSNSIIKNENLLDDLTDAAEAGFKSISIDEFGNVLSINGKNINQVFKLTAGKNNTIDNKFHRAAHEVIQILENLKEKSLPDAQKDVELFSPQIVNLYDSYEKAKNFGKTKWNETNLENILESIISHLEEIKLLFYKDALEEIDSITKLLSTKLAIDGFIKEDFNNE